MSFSKSKKFEELLRIVIEGATLKSEIPAITLHELVRGMIESGMDKELVKERLLRDLREGGPIFGEFRKQFTSLASQSVELTSSLVTNSIYKSDLPRDMLYKWVMYKAHNCEDCVERSGRDAQTLEEWELEGIPGSGVTICGLNCGCRLEPEGATEKVDERETVSASE